MICCSLLYQHEISDPVHTHSQNTCPVFQQIPDRKIEIVRVTLQGKIINTKVHCIVLSHRFIKNHDKQWQHVFHINMRAGTALTCIKSSIPSSLSEESTQKTK